MVVKRDRERQREGERKTERERGGGRALKRYGDINIKS